VKDRILEFLAVRKLAPAAKSPILCFVGPPGVGKTSLGRSIARAMGPRVRARVARRRARRGRDPRAPPHLRRRDAGPDPPEPAPRGSRNPVFLLDEIDKLGADFRGDPSSALLEVLDPEQNDTFSDHYLEVAFDLSKVMFIATANTLATIPAALLDRMEVIELPGYTERDKLSIARRHLVPKQLEAHGLAASDVDVTDDGARQARARVHARGGRAEPRPQHREPDAQGRAPRRGAARRLARRATRAGAGRRGVRRGGARRAAAPARDRRAHDQPGVAVGPRLHQPRRRHPVRRGDRASRAAKACGCASRASSAR
jgi:ATP-dependent Lon protease